MAFGLLHYALKSPPEMSFSLTMKRLLALFHLLFETSTVAFNDSL